jgi:hypothetical protein
MIDLSYIIPDMITPKTIEKQLRKSFKERFQDKTEERKNRFNGESIMLTKEEAEKHDRIFINELGATIEDKEAGIDGTSKLWEKVRKDLDWFRQHNAKAYMILLD